MTKYQKRRCANRILRKKKDKNTHNEGMIFKNGNFLPLACKLEYAALVQRLAACCHALFHGLTLSNYKPTMNPSINQTQKSTYKKQLQHKLSLSSLNTLSKLNFTQLTSKTTLGWQDSSEGKHTGSHL